MEVGVGVAKACDMRGRQHEGVVVLSGEGVVRCGGWVVDAK